MNSTILSNIVDQKTLRKVQLSTLEKIYEVISKTAGPYGSSTMISHSQRLTEYSKDGHKVLTNIKFFKPLEQSIHDELLSITEHVVGTVGDGTTTAVQLAYLIFRELCSDYFIDIEHEYSPHQIISAFQDIVKLINENIESSRRDMTLDDVYNICMISTNGNKMVSEDISNIYKKFGNSVHIQLGTSNTESSILKEYDGIVFNKGFSSPSFINKSDTNSVNMRNPKIYYFADPVDTPEMIGLFMNIFKKNIYDHYIDKTEQYEPTVILVPSISQDIKSELEDIEKIFYAYDTANRRNNKPPFCIISGVNSTVNNISDIVTLCGCPSIRKFINPDVQKQAIEEGTAPSIDNITDFYGTADMIDIDINRTKIINPKEMFDNNAPISEDGSRPFSNTYTALIEFYKNQIKISSQSKEDINLIGNLKRKLHFLQSNLVEYLVGGISASDRDNIKDLAEDAILNCRSASEYGVGYGAYFEGFVASLYVNNIYNDDDKLKKKIIEIIVKSYNELMSNLYKTVFSEDKIDGLINESLTKGCPMNLRTKSYDESVLSSIKTDQVILDAISKIITIMYTSNQALLSDPTQNLYGDI